VEVAAVFISTEHPGIHDADDRPASLMLQVGDDAIHRMEATNHS